MILTSDRSQTGAALALIAEERGRQFQKWGNQSRTAFMWLAILMEEVGEFSEAAIEDHLQKEIRDEVPSGCSYFTERLIEEMTHVAAVSTAIIEGLLKHTEEDHDLASRQIIRSSTEIPGSKPV